MSPERNSSMSTLSTLSPQPQFLSPIVLSSNPPSLNKHLPHWKPRPTLLSTLVPPQSYNRPPHLPAPGPASPRLLPCPHSSPRSSSRPYCKRSLPVHAELSLRTCHCRQRPSIGTKMPAGTESRPQQIGSGIEGCVGE
jgi:hypothetical protein